MLEKEIEKRVEWIRNILKESRANGIVVGNSGGKDCTLVLILCKMATEHVLSVMMPCESSVNYAGDRDHARLTAERFNIENVEIDLTAAKQTLAAAVKDVAGERVPMAYANMNPRLRMTALYTVAQSKNYLVAGTGNLAEFTMGYFTKWGDGAYDFNPIADLCVSEVYDYLRALGAPQEIIDKAPSAGLYEGQTDEAEMGILYSEIDRYLKTGESADSEKIRHIERVTAHKKRMPRRYGSD